MVFFKFSITEPVEMKLEITKTLHHVPLQNSLFALLLKKPPQEQLASRHAPADELLCVAEDGNLFKESNFFKPEKLPFS